MYVCICARVREGDVRQAILAGARCVDSVGKACGAGTGCGSCVERIVDLIDEFHALHPHPTTRDKVAAESDSLAVSAA